MGLCSNNDDRSKNYREKTNVTPSLTEINPDNGNTKEKEPAKKRIINRISSRTKFTNINDDYSISEIILGKGATGIVREAQDKKDGKKYAIKTVWKADIEQNECFKKEIDITLKLDHTNIVKCIGIYEDNSSIHLVLEEITGGDLFDHIIHSNNRKLTDSEAMDLLAQIFDGLHYLHDEAGIVHRDIKPENFLLYNDGRRNIIKLIDFGFATYCKDGETMNEQLGTPQYAAPEIFEQKPYTNKVDMWSVGVVLYNMIKGTQPFSNKDIDNVKEQVLHKDIDYKGFRNNQLKELCEGLLERDPEKRLTAFQAKKQLDLIKPGNIVEDTLPAKFNPNDIKMLILYNDRTSIEELKNIFLSECTLEELVKLFEEIKIESSKNKNNNSEGNMDMVSEKLYMKAEKLIEFTQDCTYSPEKLKVRLKNYCKQKVIDKIKKQMINVDNFFVTLIESIIFIRKTRCLNEFTKMDKNDLGWLSVKQIDNYFIDPIKKHNIKTELKPNDKIEFETFYKLFNEYNGIKNIDTKKHK